MLGFSVKVAENECWAIGMFELFSEDGLEDSVGFAAVFLQVAPPV